jgi:hypothetical protein
VRTAVSTSYSSMIPTIFSPSSTGSCETSFSLKRLNAVRSVSFGLTLTVARSSAGRPIRSRRSPWLARSRKPWSASQ